MTIPNCGPVKLTERCKLDGDLGDGGLYALMPSELYSGEWKVPGIFAKLGPPMSVNPPEFFLLLLLSFGSL